MDDCVIDLDILVVCWVCEDIGGPIGDNLSKRNDSILHSILGGVQLVPKVLLYHSHILPSGHLVGLNITQLVVKFLLLLFIPLCVFDKVCFFRSLYNNLRNFLGCLDLVNLQVLLETLGDDIGETHVVNICVGLDLGLGYGAFEDGVALNTFSHQKAIILFSHRIFGQCR